MNQSTIYKRNKKRLAAIRAKNPDHDPRPALVRVLAQLPAGIGTVFALKSTARSDSSSEGVTNTKKFVEKSLPQTAPGFQDTLFTTGDHGNARARWFPGAEEEKVSYKYHDKESEKIESVSQVVTSFDVILSGLVGGGMGAIVQTRQDLIQRISNQMNINTKYSNIGTGGITVVTGDPGRLQVPYTVTSHRILSSALSGGFLFGSNHIYRTFLGVEDESNPFSMKFMLSGGMTGVSVGILWSPFEVIRTKMFFRQPKLLSTCTISSSAYSYTFLDFFKEGMWVMKRSGIGGFYKYSSPIFCREVSGNIIYFSSYQYLRLLFRDFFADDPTQLEEMLHIFVSGGLAGALYWGVAFPFDTLKMIALTKKVSVREYVNMAHVKGVRSLYRGYLCTLSRSFPANALLFLGYETTKKALNPPLS